MGFGAVRAQPIPFSFDFVLTYKLPSSDLPSDKPHEQIIKDRGFAQEQSFALSRGELIVADDQWVGAQKQGRSQFVRRGTFRGSRLAVASRANAGVSSADAWPGRAVITS